MSLEGIKVVAESCAAGGDSKAQLRILQQFLHHACDDLCGRAPDYVQRYPEVVSRPGANVHMLADAVKAFARANYSKSTEEIAEAAAAASSLPKGVCGAIAGVLEARRGEIRAALGDRAAAISDAHLTDFDWSVRMIMSSDHLSKMREPVCVFTSFVTRAGGEKEEVVIELTLEKLEGLLKEFGRIDNAIQKLVS